MRNTALAWMVSGMLLLPSGRAGAQDYTFVTIDVQCPPTAAPTACPAGLAPGQSAAQTGLRGVNARGDIVGFYVAGGQPHGFLLQDGQVTTIDFPLAGVRSTIANGINARGEIVGQYTLPVHDLTHPPAEDSPLYCPSASDPACIKAFRYWHGRFSTVQFPTTFDVNGQPHPHPGTIAQRITADGDIYGCVHDHDLMMSMFGAAWTADGAISLMNDGGQLLDPKGVPMSMNNGGTPGNGRVTVGFFTDMSTTPAQQRGYTVQNGVMASYDPTATAALTAIWDINPSGQFVGTYRESGEVATKRHAFLQPQGDIAPVIFDFRCQDPSGCGALAFDTAAFATIAFGINPDGVIVGQYAIVNGGVPHGFVAIPRESN